MTNKKKKQAPKEESWGKFFRDVLVMFLVFVSIYYVVFSFFLANEVVSGPSMQPTFEDGDRLIAVRRFTPKRNDIVIINAPNQPGAMYIKRVIGLPGETIELKKGELYVNGEHVEQQFDMTPNETDFGPFPVPEGQYFVMGDNRNNSKDSRSPMVGALERRMIKGHVRCVVFPLSKARILGE